MATWCWEAAHALAESGDDVTLLVLDGVPLPGEPNPTVRIHRLARPVRDTRFIAKLRAEFGRLSARPDPVMGAFVAAERSASENPTLLLNHSGLVDPTLPACQFVAAWARESRLMDYLMRIPRHVASANPVAVVRVAFDAIGWWRRDWQGYRNATMVLATTRCFRDELARVGVRVMTVPPCVRVPAHPVPQPSPSPVRMISAALQLDEPRKRVAWMLDALRDFQTRGRALELTLVGSASPGIERRAAHAAIDVRFTGPLSRPAFLAELEAHHIFLFASALDDWGYVVAEAMSRGRAVVVPDTPPFDEMVADGGIRFGNSPGSFRDSLDRAIDTAEALGHAAHRQARQQFSHDAFALAVRSIAS